MEPSEEYVARLAAETGIPEEDIREQLDLAVECGMVEIDEDGRPRPSAELMEGVQEAFQVLFVEPCRIRVPLKATPAEMEEPFLFRPSELDQSFEGQSATLAVPRPQADPRWN